MSLGGNNCKKKDLGEEIVESALELENALADLLKAEAAKIKYLICNKCSCEELVDANESIAEILAGISDAEEAIIEKLCKGLDILD